MVHPTTSETREPLAQAALEHAGSAIVTTDVAGAVTSWNRAAEGLYGWRSEEVLGLDLVGLTVNPEDWDDAVAARSTALAGTRWEGEIAVRRKDRSSILTHSVLSPIVDLDGTISGLVTVSFDVTDRHNADAERAVLLGRERAARVEAEEARQRAERAADRAARLQRVISALGEALTVDDVHRLVVDLAADTLGAAAAVAAVLTEGGVDMAVAATSGYDADAVAAWRALRPSDPDPVAYAARTGEAVWVASGDDLRSAHPHVPHPGGLDAFAALPLVAGGRMLGALGLAYTDSGVIDEADATFLTTFAHHYAQSLDRARLFEAEVASQRRTALLAELSEQLSASLDSRTTVAKVVARVVPEVADWCAVHLLDELKQLTPMAAAHVDTDKVTSVEGWLSSFRPGRFVSGRVANVLRTGHVEFEPVIAESELLAFASGTAEADALRAIGLTGCIIVPLATRRGLLGVLTMGMASRARRFAPADLTLAEDVAERVATAIDNARLYAERADVARTLQAALLPPTLPEVPGADVSVRYRAAGEGNEVGGDFYDLFDTGDGAWAAVIGDVCGKGPEAAAVTGLARHTIRAVAMQERTPSQVLARLNDALLRHDTDRFCTVAHARLELVATGARATIACAGHPPPYIVRGDGTVKAAGRPGTAAGMFDDPLVSDVAVDLGRGEALVLYTDGVTERHEGTRIFGEEHLREVLASCSGLGASDIAGRIEEAVVSFQSGALRDDMAVLVIRIAP